VTGELRQYSDGLAMKIGDCNWPPGGQSLLAYSEREVKWIVYRSLVLSRSALKDVGRKVFAKDFDWNDVAPPGKVDAEYLWKVWKVLA
jgi:hypothetical protein